MPCVSFSLGRGNKSGTLEAGPRLLARVCIIQVDQYARMYQAPCRRRWFFSDRGQSSINFCKSTPYNRPEPYPFIPMAKALKTLLLTGLLALLIGLSVPQPAQANPMVLAALPGFKALFQASALAPSGSKRVI